MQPTLFLLPAPVAFWRVTTWVLPMDQRGIESPPGVCPRRQNDALPTQETSRIFFEHFKSSLFFGLINCEAGKMKFPSNLHSRGPSSHFFHKTGSRSNMHIMAKIQNLERAQGTWGRKGALRRCFEERRWPDGSVGMALVLPALTDCRWWFESLLVYSRVSSETRRKATGADHKKRRCFEGRSPRIAVRSGNGSLAVKVHKCAAVPLRNAGIQIFIHTSWRYNFSGPGFGLGFLLFIYTYTDLTVGHFRLQFAVRFPALLSTLT